MDSQELSPIARRLDILLAQAQQKSNLSTAAGENLHVSGLAGDVYFAYEKLRNAADYSQQHLILRSAIERFLRRNLNLKTGAHPKKIAKDLVIELTNARYFSNDSIAIKTLTEINRFVAEYTHFYNSAQNLVGHQSASRWTYQILSVALERLLDPQYITDPFIDFAYNHYLQAIDARVFDGLTPEQVRIAVYCATMRALFNSDQATTLSVWLSIGADKNKRIDDFIAACQQIDEWFDTPQTNKIGRLINRYGAPQRSIKETLQNNLSLDLHNRPKFLSALEETILGLYNSTQQKLQKSIKRAVIFIFITKLLVGIAIEIPYDLLVMGHIAYIPLAITLIVPIIYMVSAIYSIKKPDGRNTMGIINYAQRIIYNTDNPVTYRLRARVGRKKRTWFNAIYAVIAVASLTLVGWLLAKVGFHIVHAVIFFMFMSGTSLLRFRIIQSARELEIVDRPQTVFAALADFLYLPFIQLGQFLSDKYRQVNLVAFLLDLAIELPLKTILATLRSWVDFLRDKREEI
ncbi:MAG TPA: hypothetical protein VLA77_01605 [Candidatus Saccharimonadales bacterium]|nr:hypothetical protein [Candidatus Saccharimonadales bacterium]